MAIISEAFAGFRHRQFRNVTLHLNNLTNWQVEEWITELNDPEDFRVYQDRLTFSAFRIGSIVDMDVAVSPNPATKAIIAVAGGLNVGDTLTINGNDTSGGGSVAYPEFVFTASNLMTPESAAQQIANLLEAAWGISASPNGDEYDATVEMSNADSLEITGAVYFSNLPVIPADAG